jgi:hypothetical protein
VLLLNLSSILTHDPQARVKHLQVVNVGSLDLQVAVADNQLVVLLVSALSQLVAGLDKQFACVVAEIGYV